MRAAGVPDKNVFMDKQSGKDFDRPGYQCVLKRLKQDDTLVIMSIDRLGRDYDEILEQWRVITKEKKAAVVVLDMPLLDTRQGHDLTGTLIADLVFSYVAQTERESIRQRQAEGIAAAKSKGVRFGRAAFEPPEDFDEVYTEWLNGRISARKASQRLNISHQTFLKWTKKFGRENML